MKTASSAFRLLTSAFLVTALHPSGTHPFAQEQSEPLWRIEADPCALTLTACLPLDTPVGYEKDRVWFWTEIQVKPARGKTMFSLRNSEEAPLVFKTSLLEGRSDAGVPDFDIKPLTILLEWDAARGDIKDWSLETNHSDLQCGYQLFKSSQLSIVAHPARKTEGTGPSLKGVWKPISGEAWGWILFFQEEQASPEEGRAGQDSERVALPDAENATTPPTGEVSTPDSEGGHETEVPVNATPRPSDGGVSETGTTSAYVSAGTPRPTVASSTRKTDVKSLPSGVASPTATGSAEGTGSGTTLGTTATQGAHGAPDEKSVSSGEGVYGGRVYAWTPYDPSQWNVGLRGPRPAPGNHGREKRSKEASGRNRDGTAASASAGSGATSGAGGGLDEAASEKPDEMMILVVPSNTSAALVGKQSGALLWTGVTRRGYLDIPSTLRSSDAELIVRANDGVHRMMQKPLKDALKEKEIRLDELAVWEREPETAKFCLDPPLADGDILDTTRSEDDAIQLTPKGSACWEMRGIIKTRKRVLFARNPLVGVRILEEYNHISELNGRKIASWADIVPPYNLYLWFALPIEPIISSDCTSHEKRRCQWPDTMYVEYRLPGGEWTPCPDNRRDDWVCGPIVGVPALADVEFRVVDVGEDYVMRKPNRVSYLETKACGPTDSTCRTYSVGKTRMSLAKPRFEIVVADSQRLGAEIGRVSTTNRFLLQELSDLYYEEVARNDYSAVILSRFEVTSHSDDETAFFPLLVKDAAEEPPGQTNAEELLFERLTFRGTLCELPDLLERVANRYPEPAEADESPHISAIVVALTFVHDQGLDWPSLRPGLEKLQRRGVVPVIVAYSPTGAENEQIFQEMNRFNFGTLSIRAVAGDYKEDRFEGMKKAVQEHVWRIVDARKETHK